MKRLAATVAVVVMIGLFATAGYAAWQGRGPFGQVDVNAFRQYQKETLQLRDELMAKNLELRNEYAKETPDASKVTKLQNDIVSLRTEIRKAADKHDLPAWGGGRGYGFGGGMMGWGRGGRGFGGGPCYGPGTGPQY